MRRRREAASAAQRSLLAAKIVLRPAPRYESSPVPENSDARRRFDIPAGPAGSVCMHVRPRA
ncbi:hypothetical protein [Nannocystis pusilla]|uniref:hypothetical protein n=1 Tax=Nannocystis pusilla TaxID=889268 RepID=UPI003DA41F60